MSTDRDLTLCGMLTVLFTESNVMIFSEIPVIHQLVSYSFSSPDVDDSVWSGRIIVVVYL